MANKEEFKEFVKKNPRLITFIKNGDMTWQKFYEIYDIYGDSSDAWKDYLVSNENVSKAAVATTGALGINDIFSWIKNINLDSLQEGVNSLQRVIGVVKDLGNKDDTTVKKEEYKPRPIYKHFEDY